MRGVRRRARSEVGAATLAEVLIAMALAALLLGVVAGVAATTEVVAASSGSALAAQRSAAQVLASALTSISDASALGACETVSNDEPTTVLTIPLDNCTDVVEDGPPVEAASSSGAETGLCWYSYPETAIGLVPPDLRCLAAFPDGELWSFDWPAGTGTTYTNCDPSSCFGQAAPSPGELPSEPAGPTPGATLAGQVSQPGSAFAFYAQSGAPLSLSASSGAAQLALVYRVVVRASESWGGPTATTAYGASYPYSAVVGSAVSAAQQEWSAPGLGSGAGTAPPPTTPTPTTTASTTTTTALATSWTTSNAACSLSYKLLEIYNGWYQYMSTLSCKGPDLPFDYPFEVAEVVGSNGFNVVPSGGTEWYSGETMPSTACGVADPLAGQTVPGGPMSAGTWDVAYCVEGQFQSAAPWDDANEAYLVPVSSTTPVETAAITAVSSTLGFSSP